MKMEPTLSIPCPLASWVWDVQYFLADPQPILEFCAHNHVTQLYLSINNYVTDTNYVRLINLCKENGMEAIALSGDSSWVLPGSDGGYLHDLQRVDAINRLCGRGPRFQAIHFDVEPYISPTIQQIPDEKYEPLLVRLLEDARHRLDERGLRLEWDIPAWYTGRYDDIHNCPLAETFFYLCDVVCVMAYRDRPDAQLELSLPNVMLAKKYDKPVMIGCETSNLEEARRSDGNSAVSYFEEGKKYLYWSVEKIHSYVSHVHKPVGFAIHDLNRWMELQADMLP